MKRKNQKNFTLGFPRLGCSLKRFIRDEDGTLIVATLILIPLLMIVGGTAVDLIRFEQRRVILQSVTDGAVLAATKLKGDGTPRALADDYLAKSGFPGAISGTPTIIDTPAYREVSITTEVMMETTFINWPHKTELAVKASATAVQGIGDAEVSLVLDISGSMNYDIPGTSEKRIERLRVAASNFVEGLLIAPYAGHISVSLVPYSESVNIGPDLFYAIDTDNVHDFSHCVVTPPAEFDTTTFNSAIEYSQTQAFSSSAFGTSNDRDVPDVDKPICPRFEDYEKIIPLSQNAGELSDAIKLFQPRAGTSIFDGMKWAVNLLDPSFRPHLAQMKLDGKIHADFENRPTNYTAASGEALTLKFVVLMTDGENSNSYNIPDEHYDTPSKRAYWAETNHPYHQKHITDYDSEYDTVRRHSTSDGNRWLSSICDAAKEKGIKIFTIAMSVGDNSSSAIDGRAEMAKCASKPAYAYTTTGEELDAIFDDISEEVTDLRLTL